MLSLPQGAQFGGCPHSASKGQAPGYTTGTVIVFKEGKTRGRGAGSKETRRSAARYSAKEEKAPNDHSWGSAGGRSGGGLGAYGIYDNIMHPSAPYGMYPFPCVNNVTLHVHPYLRIMIEGRNVTIPANIGLISGCDEPLHTHDISGIIHVEAPEINTQYTLGHFFEIWRDTYGTLSLNGTSHPIAFNSTDILGFRADATHRVVLLVDGKPSTDYGSLVLNSLDYCSATTTGPPCSPTAVGEPSYGSRAYPFGTGHTIVIQYARSG